MPKHHADNNPENPSKDSRDSHVIRSEQAEFISITVSLLRSLTSIVNVKVWSASWIDLIVIQNVPPVLVKGTLVIVNFIPVKECDMLKQAKAKVASNLLAADDELELLNFEFELLQSRLAEVQSKIKTTLARHSRLRKQQKFLKERGFKMSDHDTELLWILDEKSLE